MRFNNQHVKIHIEPDELKGLLESPRAASRNHYISKTCPYCGDSKYHFYINFNTLANDCKKCGEAGNAIKFLTKIGRSDLVEFGRSLLDIEQIINRIQIDEESLQLREALSKQRPIGFERIFFDKYLSNERGWRKIDFEKNEVGINTIFDELKDYVTILVKEEGEVKGWVNRLSMSKEQVKLLESQGQNLIRYKNSEDEFSLLLHGLDEVTENTHTVILVEGVNDKQNVDAKLELELNEEIKCLVCFGKKITIEQRQKLLKRDIQNIVVMFDGDAINDIKKYMAEIDMDLYFNVFGCFLSYGEDPGNLKLESLLNSLNNLQKLSDFSVNFVAQKKLK